MHNVGNLWWFHFIYFNACANILKCWLSINCNYFWFNFFNFLVRIWTVAVRIWTKEHLSVISISPCFYHSNNEKINTCANFVKNHEKISSSFCFSFLIINPDRKSGLVRIRKLKQNAKRRNYFFIIIKDKNRVSPSRLTRNLAFGIEIRH